MGRAAPQIDLLAWPQVHEAQLRAQAAQAARVEAVRRYRFAPHGEVAARLQAMQAATHAALQAEAELARTEAEAAR